MEDNAWITQLIAANGLWILAPLSILEGPIVTVIASWLSRIGLLDPVAAFVCVVLGDVVGDAIMYAAGRGVRLDRLPLVGRFLKIPRPTLVPLVKAIRGNSVRMLLVGKWTHAAGFAVLIAAGAARINFGLFVLVNLLASIPKSAVFFALGWTLGEAHQRVADWLSAGTAAVFSVLVIAAVALGVRWWIKRRAA